MGSLPQLKKPLPTGLTWTWRPRDAAWIRIYHRDFYTPSATHMRSFGPLTRFDHHTAPRNKPAVSKSRSVIYVAGSIRAAAAEVFGELDIFGVCPSWRVAWVRPTAAVTVQDIVGAGAMALGTKPALGSAPLARSFTQR